MSEATKKGLVPVLRFPEFRDVGMWEETTIGEIGSFYYGKSAPKWSLEKDAPTQCVRYGELYTKFGAVITETYSLTNIDPSNLRFSKGGEILVPRVGEKPEDFGKCCCYLPLANIAIGEMISVFESAQNPLFYTYYFRNLYRQFAKVVEGQNVKNLYYVELEPLAICRPSLPEQQKIADCLSSIDELVTAQAQKVEALKAHKKGLMQQLFPAEGETVPKLRFPEFQDAGEWDETTIGNIGSFYYGKSAPKWSLEDDAPTPCVRYGELYTRFGAVITETYSRTNIDPNNLRFSKGGEILVPRVGEKPEDFGKCCCYLPLGNIAIGEMISVFETPQNPLFYTYYFRNLYRQFARVVEGQNVKNLYYVELEPLPICCPPLPEQQKIADSLFSIDELIDVQTQKLEALKAHKNGMMQKLFPSMDETTE